MTSVLREGEGDLTCRKSPCDHGGRNWSDAATSQGMPAAIRSWKRQETVSSWSLLRVPEESCPCQRLGFIPVILLSDFWLLELWEKKFLLFLSHRVCAHFFFFTAASGHWWSFWSSSLSHMETIYSLCLSQSACLCLSVSPYIYERTLYVRVCIYDSLEENRPKCYFHIVGL